MSKAIKWIIVGICIYLIMLIFTLPASQVLGRLSLPSSIKIGEVSGSIWQGHANVISVDGIVIENVDWTLSVLPLLWGQLDIQLDAGNSRDVDSVAFDGPISTSLFNMQQVSLQGAQLYLPADLVIARLPLPLPVNAGGRFKVDIETFEFTGQCQLMQGKGSWINASFIGLSEGALQLGNFDADLSCNEGETMIKINPPNVFNLDATVRIPADFQFTVEGRFKPEDSLPQQVKDAARFFGEPDNDGYYELFL